MELAWQQSLFGDPADLDGTDQKDGTDPSDGMDGTDAGLTELTFDRMRRVPLDERSWLDVAAGWLPDHACLFQQLVATAPWQQRERRMYDADVLEPRLVAAWSGEELVALPERVARIREALGRRYGVDFDSVLLNLYRDGRDGVAWHGDRVRHRLQQAVVATIGLGERRKFLLRPGTSGPPAMTLTSGEGDLIVMGGRCQNEWQHSVPKAKRAGGRMSITMRHSLPLPPDR